MERRNEWEWKGQKNMGDKWEDSQRAFAWNHQQDGEKLFQLNHSCLRVRLVFTSEECRYFSHGQSWTNSHAASWILISLKAKTKSSGKLQSCINAWLHSENDLTSSSNVPLKHEILSVFHINMFHFESEFYRNFHNESC